MNLLNEPLFKCESCIKKYFWIISMAIQWLGLSNFIVRAWSSIPVKELRSYKTLSVAIFKGSQNRPTLDTTKINPRNVSKLN